MIGCTCDEEARIHALHGSKVVREYLACLIAISAMWIAVSALLLRLGQSIIIFVIIQFLNGVLMDIFIRTDPNRPHMKWITPRYALATLLINSASLLTLMAVYRIQWDHLYKWVVFNVGCLAFVVFISAIARAIKL